MNDGNLIELLFRGKECFVLFVNLLKAEGKLIELSLFLFFPCSYSTTIVAHIY